MHLVDGIERDFHLFKEIHVFLLGKRLRRHIEELCLSIDDILLHGIDVSLTERRIDEMCDAVLLAVVLDGVNLIFHQCDEWRYDDSSSLHEQCRQLIAKRLSPSRRHKHEHIITLHKAGDNVLLLSLEMVESEIIFQGLLEGCWFVHRYWLMC